MKFKSYFVYALMAGVSVMSVACSDDENTPGEGAGYEWGDDNGAVSCNNHLRQPDIKERYLPA